MLSSSNNTDIDERQLSGSAPANVTAHATLIEPSSTGPGPTRAAVAAQHGDLVDDDYFPGTGSADAPAAAPVVTTPSSTDRTERPNAGAGADPRRDGSDAPSIAADAAHNGPGTVPRNASTSGSDAPTVNSPSGEEGGASNAGSPARTVHAGSVLGWTDYLRHVGDGRHADFSWEAPPSTFVGHLAQAVTAWYVRQTGDICYPLWRWRAGIDAAALRPPTVRSGDVVLQQEPSQAQRRSMLSWLDALFALPVCDQLTPALLCRVVALAAAPRLLGRAHGEHACEVPGISPSFLRRELCPFARGPAVLTTGLASDSDTSLCAAVWSAMQFPTFPQSASAAAETGQSSALFTFEGIAAAVVLEWLLGMAALAVHWVRLLFQLPGHVLTNVQAAAGVVEGIVCREVAAGADDGGGWWAALCREMGAEVVAGSKQPPPEESALLFDVSMELSLVLAAIAAVLLAALVLVWARYRKYFAAADALLQQRQARARLRASSTSSGGGGTSPGSSPAEAGLSGNSDEASPHAARPRSPHALTLDPPAELTGSTDAITAFEAAILKAPTRSVST